MTALNVVGVLVVIVTDIVIAVVVVIVVAVAVDLAFGCWSLDLVEQHVVLQVVERGEDLLGQTTS